MKSRAPEVDVPPLLEEAIMGGLLADRRERYSSVRSFMERLEAVELD